jgi:hypothetical protein
MAIRIRTTNNEVVALCAAESEAEPGDMYLDDNVHHALTCKFFEDFTSEGIINTQTRDRDKKISEWLGLRRTRDWPSYSYDGSAMLLIVEKLHELGYRVVMEQGSIATCSIEHTTSGKNLSHCASGFLPHVVAELAYKFVIIG